MIFVLAGALVVAGLLWLYDHWAEFVDLILSP